MMAAFLDQYLTAIQNGRYVERGQLCASMANQTKLDIKGYKEKNSQPSPEPEVVIPNVFTEPMAAKSPEFIQVHMAGLYKHADSIRLAGASSDSSGYTPPGASASGSGSSGAPTPNDLLDFSHHIDYADKTGVNPYHQMNMGVGMDIEAYGGMGDVFDPAGLMPVEEETKTKIDTGDPFSESFGVKVDGATIVWAGI